jgi:hypothetical protein
MQRTDRTHQASPQKGQSAGLRNRHGGYGGYSLQIEQASATVVKTQSKQLVGEAAIPDTVVRA